MAGIKTNEDMINALFTLGPTTSVYVIEALRDNLQNLQQNQKLL